MDNNNDDHGDSIMLIIIFDVRTMNWVNEFSKTQIRNAKFKWVIEFAVMLIAIMLFGFFCAKLNLIITFEFYILSY